MVKILPIIICGGSGSRLWPISNNNKPKQFIEFFGHKTLFDLSLERAKILTNETPIVIASRIHKKYIQKALIKNKTTAKIIFEEVGRNTTAAIVFGLKLASKINKNDFAILMPSDHFIPDNLKFKRNILNIVKSKKTIVGFY